LTRLAQRSLTLQPGHLLISLALTLSVGFSMSITLHAATQARRLLALTAAGLPSRSESHPMDHDSNSSGHTKIQDATAIACHIHFIEARFLRGRSNTKGRWDSAALVCQPTKPPRAVT